MPVKSIEKDPDALTMTVTAGYDVPVERVWQLWADPRQLERWWGPPSHPATVVEHRLEAGGTVSYFMTGPGGERFPGLWVVDEAQPPRLLRFQDAFADEDGNRNDELPTTDVTVTIAGDGAGATMEIHSRFPSREAMEQVLAMGMEEGLRQALGQIDGLLEEGAVA